MICLIFTLNLFQQFSENEIGDAGAIALGNSFALLPRTLNSFILDLGYLKILIVNFFLKFILITIGKMKLEIKEPHN